MTLTREEQYLLKEYDTAVALANHIDQLRNHVTSFFISFATAAGVGLSFLLKGELVTDSFKFPVVGIALALILVSALGAVATVVLARLRRVQLEHFRIINNVRRRFLGDKVDLWNTVELSAQTLPKPSLRSGSFWWALMIVLVSAAYFGTAICIILESQAGLSLVVNVSVAAAVMLLSLILLCVIYLKLALPRAPSSYTEADVKRFSD